MDKYEKIAREIMEETCETDEIFEDYNLNLLETGYIDSLSLLTIIICIEEKCGIKLQPSDIKKEDVSTINSFINFLKSKDIE